MPHSSMANLLTWYVLQCSHTSVFSYNVHFKMSSQLKLANFWGKKRSNSSNIWEHFGFKYSEDGVILDKSKDTCKTVVLISNMQKGTLQ